MTIAIILGTRPEIIKMAPVIRECQRRGLDYSIIHTGQHYSYQMDRIFFEQLELPQPDHNLDVGSGNHGEQTGRILADLEAVLMAERPDVVLVQGDTNTVLAGALAASKLHIKVGHVEAGLRSYDRSMPEEINRGLEMVKSEFGLPVVFPVHPRTRKMVESFGFELDGIRAIEPLGFLEFLQLEAGARLALTDSGGVQEETCILGVPCVTLRDNTERPETLEVKSNVLAGADALRMVENAKRMMQQGNGWKNPFGDGRAGRIIVEHLRN
jgi:UDP-N-acetylglucosamine 2-epimerase